MEKSFSLKEEKICDYLVTNKMKKIWKVELDMLQLLEEVCKKYNLKYFLYGGTLLGAIRHKGFIPWDDDIDVGMLREDYEKLLSIAEMEFKEPYFFQTSLTDNLFRGHAQIRNSNTAATIEKEKKLNCNQGIFIDIFPIDKIPNNKLRRKLFYYHIKIYNIFLSNYYYMNEKANNFKKRLIYFSCRIIFKFIPFRKMFMKYNAICQKHNVEKNKYCSSVMFCVSFFHDTVLYEDYTSLIYHDFENLRCLIPKNYEPILKQLYGNYMEFVRGTQSHKISIMDPDCSYKEYLKK